MAVGEFDFSENKQALDQKMAPQLSRTEMADSFRVAHLPDFNGHKYLFDDWRMEKCSTEQGREPK
jgi:hypothetical protein